MQYIILFLERGKEEVKKKLPFYFFPLTSFYALYKNTASRKENPLRTVHNNQTWQGFYFYYDGGVCSWFD